MRFDTSEMDRIPNAQPVRDAWAACRATVEEVATALTDAKQEWDALPSQVTLTGEMADLYAAFSPATATMEDVNTHVGDVNTGMEEFCNDLERLETIRSEIHGEIAQYHLDFPEGADLNLLERYRRWTRGNQIESAIMLAVRSFDEAQRSLSFYLDNFSVTPPPSVPSYYPGGGDSYDMVRANELANGLLDGSSPDPEGDYRELLAILATMRADQIAAFAAGNPNLVNLVPPYTTDAGANRQWWEDLGAMPGGQEVQDQLKISLPALIGNMEGLTYADRSEANANTLEVMLHRIAQQEAGIRDWGLTDRQITAYKNLDQTLRDGGARVAGDGVPVGLLSFNPIGDDEHPLAALVIGDLDTATHQSWYIPGMGSSLERNVGGVYGDAETIWNKQHDFLDGNESNAMVVWMGYDTPNMPPSSEVLRSTHAREGGDRLTYALNGQNVANVNRGGPMPFTSVTAHSYGTTTTAYAVTRTNFDLDSVVFFGSAGLDQAAAPNAEAFNVATDPNTGRPAVYAGTSDDDWIARLPMQIGSQEGWGPPRYSPTDKGFGGNVFQVDGENGMGSTDGHDARNDDGTGYLNEGTQSLDAIARLSTGNGDSVPLWDEAQKDEWEDIVFEAQYGADTTDGAPEQIHEP